MKFRTLLPVTLVFFLVFGIIGTGFSQESQESVFGFNTGEFSELLGAPVPRAETESRIASWDPESRSGVIAVRYVFPEGYHMIDTEEYYRLDPVTRPGFVFGATLKDRPVLTEKGTLEYFDETTALIEFHTSDTVQAGVLEVNAIFQICDEDNICLFPDSRLNSIPFDPNSASIGPNQTILGILDYNQTLVPASGTQEVLSSGVPASVGAWSLLLILLMAFAGGLLLNIMPCVLPLLSVKALNLVSQAGQDKRAIVRHSWFYVAGIEVSLWVLAAIVIILQTSGRLLGWGFQFQSPVFVLVLTALIWLFALSMFDVFVIQTPGIGNRGASQAGSRGGYTGSFLTGMFATLVAAPCTAPLLGTALGFAFSQPPLVIFAVFSTLGLGLGLPFLVLGYSPKLINKIPRPGNWMNRFRQLMGFLLSGTALYLFTTYAKLVPEYWGRALWWLLALGLAAWCVGLAQNPQRRRKLPLYLCAAIIGFLPLYWISGTLEPGGESVPNTALFPVRSDGPETLAFDSDDLSARLASGQPVFLEFTAEWCTTCKLNKRVIYNDDIQSLMKTRGIAHVIADLTAYDETMTRMLADFGRAGVPLYILYTPEKDPEILPQLLTVQGLSRELDGVL